jgi:hypothetical protein
MATTEPTLPAPGKDREVSDQERALVGAFRKRIEAVERNEAGRFRRYEEFRRYYQGTIHDDGAKGLVRTNMIFSTIATLLPATYAKDPEISVTPSEAVEPARYKVFKKFAKTLEICINRLFVREARLKVRAKAALRAAMTCQVGWVKVTFQKDIRRDPIIANRIADVQENLNRIHALGQRLEDESSPTDRELTQAELEAELAALQDQVEVAVERGITIDKLLSEQVLVLDASIRDFDDYPRASALAQVLWFDRDTFEATFGYIPGTKAKQYHADALKAVDAQNPIGSMQQQAGCWYKAYEIWDRRSMTVYTWCEGEEGWCRPPYRPERLGQRWYPFFALGLNKVDGQFYPMSDVELLIELQDEYNTTRTNFAEHRRKHLPVRVVRKGGSLTPDDVERIVNAEANEIVVVSGAAGEPLQNDMAVLEHAPVDPAVYDTAPIRADIEMVSGAMDSVRGSVLKAKTATEAEIMREGLMSRTAERQDAIEDWVQDQATYIAEILLQELTVGEVVEIAGADATWPTLSREQVYNLVQVQVAAGSTGKPNKMREREQWATLMPVVQDALAKITELRATGQADMAEALVELVRETFRRYDERIDVDSFIPPRPEGDAAGQAAAMVPQLQQQLMLAQEQMQALAQEYQACQQQLAQAQQELATRSNEIEFKRQAAEADRSWKVSDAEANRALQEQLERQKIESAERTAVRVAQVQASKELQIERLRQEGENRRAMIAANPDAGLELEEGGRPLLAMAQAIEGQGERLAAAMGELAQAMARMAAVQTTTLQVLSADQVPIRGPNGEIQRVTRDLGKRTVQ